MRFTTHMFNYIAFLVKSSCRRLTRKRSLVSGLVVLLFALTVLIFYSTKTLRMNMKKESLSKCLDFINGAVDNCLKKQERKEQNQLFAEIKTSLPIKPLKMTLTTAVFHYKYDKQNFVIKRVIVQKENPTKEDIISMSLKHPNIIKTFETRKSTYTNHKGDTQNIMWLFSELLKIKVTQRYVNRNEEVIRFIISDVIKAILYMHEEMNTVHLDLKMANIMGLIVDGVPRYIVIDFGYSRNLTNEGFENEMRIPGKAYGTFPYKPPEVILENIHGKPSDIYCIGAIAWFMSLGETPFYKDNNEKNINAHRKFIREKTKQWIHPRTSPELEDFIRKCMAIDRTKRPTIRELTNHPFITNKPYKKFKSRTTQSSDEFSELESLSDSFLTSAGT